ncbi:hypothetical protein EGW08_017326 [Elysia chlorotica]|uniref:Uncharacterized protein n=1 Tax=Elysia chlorotica TaxID=188477 RepID=A0A433T039_ELYCH|nr:hypothetical protein EGW08_017326 [Elysia chlorotica]
MAIFLCSHCVSVCTYLNAWPAALMCIFCAVLQMAVLDYYLVHHLGHLHYYWLGIDAFNVILLFLSIYTAHRAIRKNIDTETKHRPIASGSMGWLAWLFMSASVAAKSVIILKYFAHELVESSQRFFGPNTLKTTIAMGSLIFPIFLISQHDAPFGSEARRVIDDLTETTPFDILDTADILQALLESNDSLVKGFPEMILTIAFLNLILPTVQLVTLANYNYGQRKISGRVVNAHRLLSVLAVNIPNLLTRLLLWHGFTTAVSPFTLKNILCIFLNLYDIYDQTRHHLIQIENKKQNYEENSKESLQRIRPDIEDEVLSFYSVATVMEKRRKLEDSQQSLSKISIKNSKDSKSGGMVSIEDIPM